MSRRSENLYDVTVEIDGRQGSLNVIMVIPREKFDWKTNDEGEEYPVVTDRCIAFLTDYLSELFDCEESDIIDAEVNEFDDCEI